MDLGYNCYKGGHLAQTIVSSILTVAFVILCAMFTLVYYDSNPLSPNLEARAHGRAEFVFLLVKSVLVVFIDVFPHSTGARMLVVIIILSSIVLLVLYATMMPYMHHVMNKVMLATMSAFVWASIAALLAHVYPSFDAAVLLYLGMPPAAICGAYLADWRAQRIVRGSLSHMRTFFDVELKVRYTLHTALWGDPVDKLNNLLSQHHQMDSSQPASLQAAAFDDEGSEDADTRAAQVRAALPTAVIKEAEAMYKNGLLRFKGSPLLHVFAARFYLIFCDNHHLETRYEIIVQSPTLITTRYMT
jgi:hypothetical protein